MADGIVILILLVVIVPAVAYIVRAKKKGQTCIGCPHASKCGGSCHSSQIKEQK